MQFNFLLILSYRSISIIPQILWKLSICPRKVKSLKSLPPKNMNTWGKSTWNYMPSKARGKPLLVYFKIFQPSLTVRERKSAKNLINKPFFHKIPATCKVKIYHKIIWRMITKAKLINVADNTLWNLTLIYVWTHRYNRLPYWRIE